MIEDVVELVQKCQKLPGSVILDDIIEPIDVKENQTDLSLGIREVLLPLPHLVSYKRWNKDIQDLLKLGEVPNFSVSIDKLCLLFKLLHVNIC